MLWVFLDPSENKQKYGLRVTYCHPQFLRVAITWIVFDISMLLSAAWFSSVHNAICKLHP